MDIFLPQNISCIKLAIIGCMFIWFIRNINISVMLYVIKSVLRFVQHFSPYVIIKGTFNRKRKFIFNTLEAMETFSLFYWDFRASKTPCSNMTG